MTPNDYIIAIDPTVWQEDPEQPAYNPQPSNSTLIADYDNGVPKQAYLASPFTFSLSDWPAGAYIVGGWSGDTGLQLGQDWDDSEPPVVVGTPTYPLHADYYLIRPLGNKDGRATGKLVTPLFQGHSWDKYVEDDSWYPATDAPFDLKLTRENRGADAPAYDAGTTYAEGDYAYSTPGTVWRSLQDNNVGNPQFGGSAWWEFVNPAGWGWRCDVVADDPNRVVTSRAIAIYSDPACTAYLGTSGAFVDDGSGNFYCECPTALYTATKEPVHWALLFGASQEGHYTMEVDEAEANFWAGNQ